MLPVAGSIAVPWFETGIIGFSGSVGSGSTGFVISAYVLASNIFTLDAMRSPITATRRPPGCV